MLFSANFSHAVIHGEDDRIDLCFVQDLMMESWTSSTAAMISKQHFKEVGDSFVLKSRPREFYLPKPFCPDAKEKERFIDQMSVAVCSGFLIAPDLLITAGHCIASKFLSIEQKCKNFFWVFDYKVSKGNDDLSYSTLYDSEYDYTEKFISKTVSKKNVYNCNEIISYAYTEKETNKNNYKDYAVIKLDRKVTDRVPLYMAKQRRSVDGTSLIAIGTPLGLPMKISMNGAIIGDYGQNIFMTNLDVMHKSSGSPVINIITGLVEGIVVKGLGDYILQDGCYTPLVLGPEESFVMVFRSNLIPLI